MRDNRAESILFEIVLTVFYVAFIWWFSTGAVLYLDGMPKRTFVWTNSVATVLFAGSLWGLASSADDATVGGAFCGLTSGLIAWSWQEITFYTGWITGPRRTGCPDGCRGWRHFGHALGITLWHEIAILLSAAVIAVLTWDKPNQVGLWTFLILWWMHESARLNVFLGVWNLNEEFVPAHLDYLKSFLTKKRINLLFPVSVTVSTVAMVLLIQAMLDPMATHFERTSYAILTALTLLALLEHWFMVLPLPFAALWRWALKSHEKTRATLGRVTRRGPCKRRTVPLDENVSEPAE